MPSSKRYTQNLVLSVLIPLPLSLVGYDPFGPLETFVAYFTGPFYLSLILATDLINVIDHQAISKPTTLQITAILVTSVFSRIGIGLWLLHLLRNSPQALSFVVTTAMSLFFLSVGIMYIVGSQQ